MEETLFTLVPVIILLPLIGALVNTFAIRDGRRAGLIASAACGLAFVAGLVAFGMLAGLPAEERTHVDFTLWQWIDAGPLQVPFGFLFDPLSAVMVLLITGVGSLIHIFSIGYMAHDSRPVRYFVYLNLFVTAMLILVLANNYLLLFLGWEGVGLCSYLLIGHSFEKQEARAASMKAFVMNRIGDFGLMLAMLALFQHFGSLNFGVIFERAGELAGQQINWVLGPTALVSAIAFCMLIGVTGKSAQIPLWTWLPDAMAGPTPASALIHAATMVTSGVYLIVRSHSIFVLTPAVSNLTVYVGTATAFIAASIAIGQYDIKRVLAFSTVSQLGFMVAAAGMGAYTAAIFHLLTHGIFKALLFLGAGSVIHGAHEVQDMRRMGGLRKAMPTTFWTYMAGTLALAGIFPLAGFWSKDEIVGAAFHGTRFGTYPIVGGVLIITAALTAFYMSRQISLVFLNQQRDTSYHAHESERIMTVPLQILAVGAVIAGLINFPFGFYFLEHWLEPTLEIGGGAAEPLEFNFVLAAITVALALAAGWVAYQVYGKRQWKKTFRDPLARYLGVFFEGFEHRWYADDVYDTVFVRPYRAIASFLSRVFDPLGIDGLVNGAGRLVGLGGRGLRVFQTGYVRSYTLVFLIGVVAVLGYFGFATR